MRQSNPRFFSLFCALTWGCYGSKSAPQRAAVPPSASAESVAAPAVSSPDAPRPRPASSPAPSPSLPPSPLWTTCSEHFAPRAAAHVDVLRLGMLCGPSNGLALLARASGVVDEARSPFSYQWEAERGDCFRVFGVAEEPVDDLEVEVFGPRHDRLLLENQNHRWVVVGENGPFCAPRAGTFEAQFSTHGGRGTVAISVWRGAHMLAVGKSRTKL